MKQNANFEHDTNGASKYAREVVSFKRLWKSENPDVQRDCRELHDLMYKRLGCPEHLRGQLPQLFEELLDKLILSMRQKVLAVLNDGYTSLKSYAKTESCFAMFGEVLGKGATESELKLLIEKRGTGSRIKKKIVLQEILEDTKNDKWKRCLRVAALWSPFELASSVRTASRHLKEGDQPKAAIIIIEYFDWYFSQPQNAERLLARLVVLYEESNISNSDERLLNADHAGSIEQPNAAHVVADESQIPKKMTRKAEKRRRMKAVAVLAVLLLVLGSGYAGYHNHTSSAKPPKGVTPQSLAMIVGPHTKNFPSTYRLPRGNSIVTGVGVDFYWDSSSSPLLSNTVLQLIPAKGNASSPGSEFIATLEFRLSGHSACSGTAIKWNAQVNGGTAGPSGSLAPGQIVTLPIVPPGHSRISTITIQAHASGTCSSMRFMVHSPRLVPVGTA